MPTGPPDQSPPVEADFDCPELDALAHHVSAFAHLLTRPDDATLTEWIKRSARTTYPRCTPTSPASNATWTPSPPA